MRIERLKFFSQTRSLQVSVSIYGQCEPRVYRIPSVNTVKTNNSFGRTFNLWSSELSLWNNHYVLWRIVAGAAVRVTRIENIILRILKTTRVADECPARRYYRHVSKLRTIIIIRTGLGTIKKHHTVVIITSRGVQHVGPPARTRRNRPGSHRYYGLQNFVRAPGVCVLCAHTRVIIVDSHNTCVKRIIRSELGHCLGFRSVFNIIPAAVAWWMGFWEALASEYFGTGGTVRLGGQGGNYRISIFFRREIRFFRSHHYRELFNILHTPVIQVVGTRQWRPEHTLLDRPNKK